MAKNHMAEVAKMLGVELGEAFEIKGQDNGKYMLTEKGVIYVSDGGYTLGYDNTFIRVLTGKAKIVRRPWRPKKWRPKKGQEYWSVLSHKDGSWCIDNYDYDSYMADINRILLGNCFPTREAAEAAAPEIAKFYNDVRKMGEEG